MNKIVKNKISEMQKKIFSNNLVRIISERGIDQTKVANDLAIPETTMSAWVRGENYPRIDKIQMLADYFNIYKSDLTEEPINIVLNPLDFPLVFSDNDIDRAKQFLLHVGVSDVSEFSDEDIIRHANFLRTSIEMINQSKKER